MANGTLALTVAGAISGSSKITVDTGAILALGGTSGLDRIGNAIPLTLAGGTFSTEGQSNDAETLGTFALSANSTIDFGIGLGDSLLFAGVGTHGAGTKLSILNWSGTPNQAGGVSSDRLIFNGASIGAFTSLYNQADVSFNGANGFLAIQYDATHYEIVAIPEPSIPALFAAALFSFAGFRRRVACRR